MDGSISWTGTAGTACPDGMSMSPDTPYFIASVDKLYTATAILKLHERGQLDLDERVSSYLPPDLVDKIHVSGGVDHSARITVRNLLGHTSGLADYLEDRPRGGRSMIEHLVDGGGDVALGVADAMRMVREDLTPHFLPQDPHSRRPKARYSDTNFLLLIAIIETLFQLPLHDVFAELVFAPAGMHHTYFLGTTEPAAPTPEPATLWFADQAFDLPQVLTSLRSIYSTVSDQIASLRALLNGELFDDPATLDLMQQHWKRFGQPLDSAGHRTHWVDGIVAVLLPRLQPAARGDGRPGHSGSGAFPDCGAEGVASGGGCEPCLAATHARRTSAPT
ncbi:MAG: beta-lactamase family protein [Candidatus Aminicenantes bacterium]|nr:beta-lactamase family protein [Candidatus Aminicenantes bacterium]